MEEACCSPNAEVAAAALKVWDNVHTVLNSTIWSSCWDSVAELLTTLNLTHMERNDLGKGYPDADPRNFILKGLTPHCSVESVITASRVMIDW